MRNRIWNNLSNIKFKALYTNALSRRSHFIGNIYSAFLSVVSAGSVATWALWKEHPSIWAGIVAISQILHIVKSYIPFIKHEKEFLEMSFEYEGLYLEYEKLWYNREDQRENLDEEKEFYELRQKENDIEKMHKQVQCPKWNRLKKRIQEETYTDLSLNFESGDNYVEQKAITEPAT